jgi:putative ABC transport system ATP-binding protein
LAARVVRSTGAAAIRLEGVEKVYRTDRIETVALSNVNLEVGEGELVAVMGPSGCGKSTLLNLMGLLDAPSKGRVSLGGRELGVLSDRERSRYRNREIGFVFQTFHLIPELSVLDNVEIPLLYRRASASERRTLALAALDRVGLFARAPLPVAALGRQRAPPSPARSWAVVAARRRAHRQSRQPDNDEVMGIIEGLNRTTSRRS